MQIRFREIRVQNGLSWRKLRIPLDKQGLILLSGDNGTGKTSIGELLGHAFYEKTLKSGRKNAVVNRSARRNKEGMRIEILFDINSTEGEWVPYRLVQTQNWHHKEKNGNKPSNGIRIWRNRTPDPITPVKDPIKAQKLAEEILGMSWEEFCASVYLPHRMVHPLTTGTPATRARYVTDAYDLKRYDELCILAKEAREEVDSKIGEYSGTEGRLETLLEEISALPDIRKTQNACRDIYNQVKSTDYNLEQTESKLHREIRRREGLKRRKKVTEKLQSVTTNEEPDKVRTQLRKLRKKQDILRTAIPGLRRAQQLRDKLRHLRAQLPKKPNQRFSAASLRKVNRQIGNLESQIDFFSKLQGLQCCPTCRQPIPNTIQSGEQNETLKSELKRHRRREKRLERLKDETVDYRRAVSDVNEIVKQLDELPDTPAEKIEIKINEIQQMITVAEALFERVLRVETLRQELRELPIGNLRKTESRIEILTNKKREIQRKLQKLRNALTLAKDGLRRAQRLHKTIQKVRKQLNATHELATKRRLLDGLVQAFGNRGLKLERMREIIGAISDQLPLYADMLLPNYSFSLTEKESGLNFVYMDRRDPDGGSEDVVSLSEGERKRLSLCLLLSERDIRLVQTNLLFLDEFDGGLDDDGKESLITILRNLRSVYGSILAISHDTQVRGHSAFDSRFLITRKGSNSRIQKLSR